MSTADQPFLVVARKEGEINDTKTLISFSNEAKSDARLRSVEIAPDEVRSARLLLSVDVNIFFLSFEKKVTVDETRVQIQNVRRHRHRSLSRSFFVIV